MTPAAPGQERASIATRRACESAARLGVNWWVWRPVVAGGIPDGLAEVRRWRFRDLYESHVVLDTLEALKAEAEAAAKRKQAAKKGR